MFDLILLTLGVIVFALYCAFHWQGWSNSIRGWRCKLPDHQPRLRFKGLRIHYACTDCHYEWSVDRHRGKASLKAVK